MIRKTLAATTLALTTLAALPAAAEIITTKFDYSIDFRKDSFTLR